MKKFIQRPEIDIKEVIESNNVTVINLDALSKADNETKTAISKVILGDALDQQSKSIKLEKSRLANLSEQSRTPINDLCMHSIRDEFHGSEDEFKCLVCGTSGFIENLAKNKL